MATIEPKILLQQQLAQHFLAPIEQAVELARRYRDVDDFRDYVRARVPQVLAGCALILATAIACGMAPVMLLVGTQALATILGLLLMPLVLVGALLALGMTFFSWLEERAIARALGRRGAAPEGRIARWLRKKLRVQLGKAPRVPWMLATVFVVAPLAVLVARAPGAGVLLVVLLVLAPLGFARLDH